MDSTKMYWYICLNCGRTEGDHQVVYDDQCWMCKQPMYCLEDDIVDTLVTRHWKECNKILDR